ncbi:trypsin-like serine peptidase [Kitasatospora sp. NPDC048365]|uniref:trypsin-like serine peptidase n=1 Tax=Kitasatospora sp. NPDC048365 TaxID=3364050 RepID=UPI0037110A86
MATFGGRARCAALAAAVLLGAAACTSGGGDSPPSWEALRGWHFQDWDDWAKRHAFSNPVAQNFWTADTLDRAEPRQPEPAPPPPSPSATAEPVPVVRALPAERPYTRFPATGKIFMTAPKGGVGQCSATVVADPAHPGKSDLVWTAAHCVHEGKGGDWYQNLIFVPAYNSSGAASGGHKAGLDETAPYGQWWADKVITSPLWTTEGTRAGDAANQYDFAVIRVRDPKGGGKSLEETIGTAVPVWFDAPREQLAVSVWGYPSVAPFDGKELEHCEGGRPGSRSFDAARPAMLTIGCTMTAGASGGGWFATMPDGRQALVSNTSIGTAARTTLNGPYLETVARQALDYLAKK